MAIMIVLYAAAGLLTGIVLNLCADQLPRWRRLRRRPFCPTCDRVRPWRAGSGTLAYLSGTARCPQCGARISWRHPLVEVGTAALFAFLWARYRTSPLLIPYTLYAAIFILVIVIDLEHKLILNVVMYPAWILALVASFFHPTPYFYRLALLGGVLGFGLLYLVYLSGVLFVKSVSRARGKDLNAVAFGFGDVRLGAFIGLVLGFPSVLTAIFLAVFLGGLGGLLYWLIRAVILRRYSLFTAIPYGPYLVLAAMAIMFFGSKGF
jgi:leader peptidase (prepilin peptidase)/N-methyltransferase